MMSRDRSVRRPSSSAETSIDEDTADQLLADDFSVPESVNISRQGTMSFARPTSSAFDSQRRNSSMASSQTFPIRPPATLMTHSQQPSVATYTEPEISPPTTALLGGPSAPQLVRPRSAVDTINSSYGNPFVDPTEPFRFISMPEKKQSARPLPVPEKPRKSNQSKRYVILFPILALVLLLAVVLIPVGLLVIKPKARNHSSDPSSNDGLTAPNNRDPTALGIPQSAIGTVLDSTKWLDWTDFNVSYTAATVGGLSLMVHFPVRPTY
jgi:hypothetical protein